MVQWLVTCAARRAGATELFRNTCQHHVVGYVCVKATVYQRSLIAQANGRSLPATAGCCMRLHMQCLRHPLRNTWKLQKAVLPLWARYQFISSNHAIPGTPTYLLYYESIHSRSTDGLHNSSKTSNSYRRVTTPDHLGNCTTKTQGMLSRDVGARCRLDVRVGVALAI